MFLIGVEEREVGQVCVCSVSYKESKSGRTGRIFRVLTCCLRKPPKTGPLD